MSEKRFWRTSYWSDVLSDSARVASLSPEVLHYYRGLALLNEFRHAELDAEQIEDLSAIGVWQSYQEDYPKCLTDSFSQINRD